MTDSPNSDGQRPEEQGVEPRGPVVNDSRKVDPETGAPRHSAGAGPSSPMGSDNSRHPAGSGASGPAGSEGASQDPQGDALAQAEAIVNESGDLIAAQNELAERTEDLQRLQAEFVNYRARVDRDRSVAADHATASVIASIVPVLDDIDAARQAGDLSEGPFASIASKLEAALGSFGVERFGEVGEVFDPAVHEALMHQPSEEATETTVSIVVQPGYRIGEKVIRPARVAVTGPEA